ncbi:MAG: hypothetical protein M4D80_30475 [Myxococcota bacterium]|nr:hypothetical protein [Deltaproteobacteria bacterium]MDQ3339512.1 hypothetical protein [Myxococcota bacterium]
MTSAQSSFICERIARLLATKQGWPAQAWENPPALLVYATDSMFAYYLAADGTAYVYDMDRFLPELDVVDEATKREVYRRAGEEFPVLAGLVV